VFNSKLKDEIRALDRKLKYESERFEDFRRRVWALESKLGITYIDLHTCGGNYVDKPKEVRG
jgi:hypothetical protein